MPSLRTLLGKQVDAIPRPKNYTFKFDFAPLALFGGQTPPLPVSICQPVPDSEITPHCAVTPDFLPALLELAQPQVTRGAYSFGEDSTSLPVSICQDVMDSTVLHCAVMPDCLQEAYLSPHIIETERFPLAIQFFDVAALFTATVVYGNLLHLFVAVQIYGMNYRDRILRELRPPEDEEQIVARKMGTKPLSKSYEEPETKQRRGRKSKPKAPSFWDLLYVILQPPINLESFEDLYLPSELLPHQPAGIRFLMDNESALLADEMGTGKTVMTAVALRILMQQGRASRALVVCPLSVLREWNQHLAEWSPDLRVTFVRGNQDRRVTDWEMPAHVYVTTYDTLRSDIETATLPKDKLTQFDVVVLDEAQNIKNPTSSRSRAIKRLQARQRWALTGTPLENKLEDIASLFEFLRPGYLKPFDLYSARGVKEKIAPYFLRRRKEDVFKGDKRLPPMQKQNMILELDLEQRNAYD